MKSLRLTFLIATAFAAVVVFTGFAAAQNPVPLISEPLVPDAKAPGGAGFTLTVNGAGFVSGSVVQWNGSPRVTAFVSESRLTADIQASDIANAGTASVTVVSPAPGGGISNAVLLPITEPSLSIALSAPAEFDVGSSPSLVAVGDFNGDGRPDLAVVERSTNTVSILLGNGNGTFQAPADYPTGVGPSGIAIGDFNGDGKLDLAIVNNNSGTVSILLGKGDGTFEARTDYNTGLRPQTVAVGDFNRDGKLDLAVANYGPDYTSSTVSILLGNGDGTFQPQAAYAAGVNPIGVLVGDLNRDGKLDLAVLDNNAPFGISILLGNGDGSFQNPVLYPAGTNSRVGIVADFNSDGKLDLAVANYTDNDVSILLGNGDGSFQAPVNYPVGGGPSALRGADLNGDGKLDLVTENQNGNSLSVLFGNGDGTFQVHTDYSGGPGPQDVAVGDFNADGRLDVALADNSSNTVSVLLQGPTVSLSKTSLAFSDQVIGTPSASLTVTLTNGALPLTVSSIAITGADLADFAQTNTCDSGLPSGGKCTITVIFNPTSVGPRSAFVTITDDAAGSPQEIALTGIGLVSGPNATLSSTSLTFATWLVGTTSSAQFVTMKNYGTAALSITGIGFTGADPSDFAQSNGCGSSLAPRASCTISINFKPIQPGSRTAILSLSDNAPGGPQSVSVTGTGTDVRPSLTLSTTGLTFATQLTGTTSPAQSVKLTNEGTAVLSITGIGFAIPDPGDFAQTHTCGSWLAAGASCMISVTFKPSGINARSASLWIADNAIGSPQTIALNGEGTAVKLNPASLNFGTEQIGHSESLSVTLTNVGSTTLGITGITRTGSSAFSQTNNCDSSVGAGKSCTITVTFYPGDSRGFFTGAISISDNGGASPQQVSLSGKVSFRSSPAVQSALTANSNISVPEPTGPSPVGTRIAHLVDSTRDETFLSKGNKRELPVRFWYPASLTQGCDPAQYTSPRVWGYFSQLASIRLPEVRTNSCRDVPVTDGVHPVVVFTHGYTGTFTDYTFIFEDLASRGYVVASVDHTYEATAVEFPDGRFVQSVLGSHLANTWQMDKQSLSLALSVRSQDLKFVANELERLNADAASPFFGKLDISRMGLMGHSLGGQAALSGVEQGSRFRAGVLIDGVLTEAPVAVTETPILILAAGRDWSGNERLLWEDSRGPRLAVNFKGAEHLTPTDAVWLARGAIETGPMGLDKTISAIRSYIAAFLDASLRGQPLAPVLGTLSLAYPDAVVTTRSQSLPGQGADQAPAARK